MLKGGFRLLLYEHRLLYEIFILLQLINDYIRLDIAYYIVLLLLYLLLHNLFLFEQL